MYTHLSNDEPLGTELESLPGQIKFDTGVELETDGYRIGFPKDSHCDDTRKHGSDVYFFKRSLGMKCCNMNLFQSMHNTILDLKADDSFNVIDRRFVAQVAAMLFITFVTENQSTSGSCNE